MSASDIAFEKEFDAVFSNAALHWMKDADRVVRNIARALRPTGRFVAEMGGYKCVDFIRSALVEELNCRGYDGNRLVHGVSPLWRSTAPIVRRRASTCRISN